MEEADDFALALQLQAQFDEEISSVSNGDEVQILPPPPDTDCEIVSSAEKEEMSLIDPRWETIDPIPDIRALFLEFNDKYFWGKLAGIEVRWSPRMTLCAGLCVYEGRGGMCSVRLSEPLLKLRPRKDLIETLLHEMIHAYLFVTDSNKDHDGHGPEFCKHMHRLNKRCGTKISIYHNFHDEVDHYKQHWWRCNGPCQERKPYYGYVKRAMNRAPSAQDFWWAEHQATCGGTYTKIKEPEGYGKKKDKKKEDKEAAKKESAKGSGDIRTLFKKNEDTSPPKPSSSTSFAASSSSSTNGSGSSFPGSGVAIGGSSIQGPIVRKIPGFGTITTERNSAKDEVMNNGKDKEKSDTKNRDNASYREVNGAKDRERSGLQNKNSVKGIAKNNVKDSNGKMKRTLSISDSEVEKKKPKLTDTDKVKKKRKSLSDYLKDKSSTPPGTAEKIPGFRSTANRNNWNDKKKKNTSPRENDDIYIPLGNRPRPNVTPNSVLSKEERAKMRARINGINEPPATFTPMSTNSGGIWDHEVKLERTNHGASPSRIDADKMKLLTSARNKASLWTVTGASGSTSAGARNASEGATQSPLAGASGSTSAGAKGTSASATQSALTGASSSSLAGASGVEGALAGATGVQGTVAGAKTVTCPVCSIKVPESEINAHLDSCLS